MRLPRLLVVGLLVVGFTPGANELLSDAAHLLLEGHSAHAASHGEHEGPGPEHGCSGWHHTCPCHSSLSFAAVSIPAVQAAFETAADARREPRDRGPAGVVASLERPPRV